MFSVFAACAQSSGKRPRLASQATGPRLRQRKRALQSESFVKLALYNPLVEALQRLQELERERNLLPLATMDAFGVKDSLWVVQVGLGEGELGFFRLVLYRSGSGLREMLHRPPTCH